MTMLRHIIGSGNGNQVNNEVARTRNEELYSQCCKIRLIAPRSERLGIPRYSPARIHIQACQTLLMALTSLWHKRISTKMNVSKEIPQFEN